MLKILKPVYYAFKFFTKIIFAVCRFLKKNIRLAVILMLINLILFTGILSSYYSVVKDLDELNARNYIYERGIQQQVKGLLKTLTELVDLTVRNDIDQLSLIADIENRIANLVKIQIDVEDRLSKIKTIDLPEAEKILKANLVIYNSSAGYSGSGTHIRKGNVDYILTVAHLIDNPEDSFIAVENEANENIFIELVNFDIKKDLALFRMKKVAKHIPVLEISSEFPKVGSDIIVIGNPASMEDVITDGILAKTGKGRYLLTNKVYYGNSGGAVLYKGKIVGVVSEMFLLFDIPYFQNYTVAVDLKSIQQFLEDCNI